MMISLLIPKAAELQRLQMKRIGTEIFRGFNLPIRQKEKSLEWNRESMSSISQGQRCTDISLSSARKAESTIPVFALSCQPKQIHIKRTVFCLPLQKAVFRAFRAKISKKGFHKRGAKVDYGAAELNSTCSFCIPERSPSGRIAPCGGVYEFINAYRGSS